MTGAYIFALLFSPSKGVALSKETLMGPRSFRRKRLYNGFNLILGGQFRRGYCGENGCNNRYYRK